MDKNILKIKMLWKEIKKGQKAANKLTIILNKLVK